MMKTIFFVRFTECDPYGIASHPVYFNWLTECRIDYFRKCGLTLDDFSNSNILLVIVKINMLCRGSCTFGDMIEIETILEKLNKKSITFKYIAKNLNTDKVLFEAKTVNFVINKDGKSSKLPDYIYEKIHDLSK